MKAILVEDTRGRRFKVGWPGLLPDGCLVLSGEGCGVPAGFVTVRMA